jgi:hypothetical protein
MLDGKTSGLSSKILLKKLKSTCKAFGFFMPLNTNYYPVTTNLTDGYRPIRC